MANKRCFVPRQSKICGGWFRARGHREHHALPCPSGRKESGSRPTTPIADRDALGAPSSETALASCTNAQRLARRLSGLRLLDDRYILRLAARDRRPSVVSTNKLPQRNLPSRTLTSENVSSREETIEARRQEPLRERDLPHRQPAARRPRPADVQEAVWLARKLTREPACDRACSRQRDGGGAWPSAPGAGGGWAARRAGWGWRRAALAPLGRPCMSEAALIKHWERTAPACTTHPGGHLFPEAQVAAGDGGVPGRDGRADHVRPSIPGALNRPSEGGACRTELKTGTPQLFICQFLCKNRTIVEFSDPLTDRARDGFQIRTRTAKKRNDNWNTEQQAVCRNENERGPSTCPTTE
uniref:Uncharacterized protein n=1 Tax=Heliothis virescens TaxID=7102 RepID=A0A2A4K1A5_HELVI